ETRMGPDICKGYGGVGPRRRWSRVQSHADPDDLGRKPLAASRSRNTAPVQFLSGLSGRHIGKLAEYLTEPLSAFRSLALVLDALRIKAAQPHASGLGGR